MIQRYRHRSLLLSWLLVIITLLGGRVDSAGAQQTSLPGAVGLNGNFYVLRDEPGAVQVWEWNDLTSTWQKPLGGRLASPSMYGVWSTSRPAGRTPTGGFHAIVRLGTGIFSSQSRLARWEPVSAPKAGFTLWQYAPNATTADLSEPSEYFGGRYICTVGLAGTQRTLYQVDTVTGVWTPHAGFVNLRNPREDTPVCVLNSGQFFMPTWSGRLLERWHTGGGNWAWGDHGRPGLFRNAVHVGAAMPTNKVFVTTDNGALWQYWWDSGANAWRWHNHGVPFGWRVDSTAVAIADGKLFVTGDWDHSGGNTRVLLQLFYDNGNWRWHDHGTPPGTSIAEGGAAVAFGGRHVVVKGSNGLFYMCYYDWGTSSWLWKNCGTPP